jgi:hypothetical protein
MPIKEERKAEKKAGTLVKFIGLNKFKFLLDKDQISGKTMNIKRIEGI